MKFLDLFAGIGGFRLGMEAAGHECVGFCEIDKFARESYKAIHDTKGEIELHDITAVSDDTVRGIGHVDVICGGFPCQAFSIAGKRQGFEDTRGTLFFEIARFASILRPRLLFLENVKGLLNHDGGDTFETILSALDELGYDVEWQVLNSKNFGVPQNRERVFIIGHLRGASTRGIFPFGGNYKENSENYIMQVNDSKKIREQLKYENIWRVIDTRGIAPTLDTMQGGNREPKIIQRSQSVMKIGNVNPSGNGMNGEVYQADGLAPTLTTNKGEGQKIGIPILTPEAQGVGTPDFRIRKLTPRECWRLQGFPDWAFDKAQEVNSNSQLYKQAGNSVTVNVIEAIARELG